MNASPNTLIRQDFKTDNGFLPTTFLERGVAVPFTTPLLAGARARPGQRIRMELIVPNPSGGRGVYILPWDSITGFCRPTLHDRRLTEAVAALRGVTPEAIRHTARDVAAEGLAGRGASAAASVARDGENQARLQANFDLLLEVVRQNEPKGESSVLPELDHPVELERRAKRAVALVARSLGCSPESVVQSLEELAQTFSSIGVGRDGWIPRVIANLVRLRREVAEHAERNSDASGPEARLVASAADLTIILAKATLADVQSLSGDIVTLLRRWQSEPDELRWLMAKPDWLLDGWDRLCALWETAPVHLGVGPTIVEMAALAPVVPREAALWAAQTIDLETVELLRYRRRVPPLEDWRTGVTVYDLIARNESLLEKVV